MATENPMIETDATNTDNRMRLGTLDLVVIVVYFFVVLGVGIWSSYRSRRGVTGYFLASRNMHWIPVGASIFASNIGSEHFIGLAGSGAAKGIGVICYEQSAVYILMLLGWIFVPVYMSSGVYTMPEYLRMRFGGQRIRVYISGLSLILYIFTKISADLYAGALFIQMGFNKSSTEWLYISVLIILGVAAVFAIAGGLSAVMWTDFVQTVLMVVGSIYLAIKAFDAVGGFNELVRKYPTARASIAAHDANNKRCAEPPGDYMHLFRSPVPGESDLPWTGIIFGFFVSAIWHWCSDQVIVQRALAARNLSHAKAGTILTSYLKFLPLWVIVFPGMASRILYPDRVGCAHPDECERICGIRGGCSNIAFTEIALNLLPPGLSGLMLAVVLAALVSSLTSIFNSASTVFTIDVWMRFRKNPTERELVLVGRVFVVFLVVISVLWIPFIQNSKGSQLFEYIQSIGSFLNAPITAVFLLAFFWKRTNEKGAFCGLMVGLVIGMIRFVLEFAYEDAPCGDEPIHKPPGYEMMVTNIHFLHFRMLLFVITIIITVTVSLLTRPIPEECLYRLTFWTRHSTKVRLTLAEARGDGYRPAGDTAEDNAASLTDKEGRGEASSKSMDERKTEALQGAEAIREDPRTRIIVGVNAVICLCLATFVFGFFA